MQDIMPPVGAGAQLIQSYGPNGFRIGNAEYSHSVFVEPHTTHVWDGMLQLESIFPLLDAYPTIEVLLIGTGTHHQMLPPQLKESLRARGISVDSMNTGAACRTFNVLLGEGRRLAALLHLSA